MILSERKSALATLILFFAMLPWLTGCIDLSGQRRRQRDQLLEERDRLDSELRRHAPLFTERDMLRQELNNLLCQQEQLNALQKLREAQKK